MWKLFLIWAFHASNPNWLQTHANAQAQFQFQLSPSPSPSPPQGGFPPVPTSSNFNFSNTNNNFNSGSFPTSANQAQAGQSNLNLNVNVNSQSASSNASSATSSSSIPAFSNFGGITNGFGRSSLTSPTRGPILFDDEYGTHSLGYPGSGYSMNDKGSGTSSELKSSEVAPATPEELELSYKQSLIHLKSEAGKVDHQHQGTNAFNPSSNFWSTTPTPLTPNFPISSHPGSDNLNLNTFQSIFGNPTPASYQHFESPILPSSEEGKKALGLAFPHSGLSPEVELARLLQQQPELMRALNLHNFRESSPSGSSGPLPPGLENALGSAHSGQSQNVRSLGLNSAQLSGQDAQGPASGPSPSHFTSVSTSASLPSDPSSPSRGFPFSTPTRADFFNPGNSEGNRNPSTSSPSFSADFPSTFRNPNNPASAGFRSNIQDIPLSLQQQQRLELLNSRVPNQSQFGVEVHYPPKPESGKLISPSGQIPAFPPSTSIPFPPTPFIETAGNGRSNSGLLKSDFRPSEPDESKYYEGSRSFHLPPMSSGFKPSFGPPTKKVGVGGLPKALTETEHVHFAGLNGPIPSPPLHTEPGPGPNLHFEHNPYPFPKPAHHDFLHHHHHHDHPSLHSPVHHDHELPLQHSHSLPLGALGRSTPSPYHEAISHSQPVLPVVEDHGPTRHPLASLPAPSPTPKYKFYFVHPPSGSEQGEEKPVSFHSYFGGNPETDAIVPTPADFEAALKLQGHPLGSGGVPSFQQQFQSQSEHRDREVSSLGLHPTSQENSFDSLFPSNFNRLRHYRKSRKGRRHKSKKAKKGRRKKKKYLKLNPNYKGKLSPKIWEQLALQQAQKLQESHPALMQAYASASSQAPKLTKKGSRRLEEMLRLNDFIDPNALGESGLETGKFARSTSSGSGRKETGEVEEYSEENSSEEDKSENENDNEGSGSDQIHRRTSTSTSSRSYKRRKGKAKVKAKGGKGKGSKRSKRKGSKSQEKAEKVESSEEFEIPITSTTTTPAPNAKVESSSTATSTTTSPPSPTTEAPTTTTTTTSTTTPTTAKPTVASSTTTAAPTPSTSTSTTTAAIPTTPYPQKESLDPTQSTTTISTTTPVPTTTTSLPKVIVLKTANPIILLESPKIPGTTTTTPEPTVTIAHRNSPTIPHLTISLFPKKYDLEAGSASRKLQPSNSKENGNESAENSNSVEHENDNENENASKYSELEYSSEEDENDGDNYSSEEDYTEEESSRKTNGHQIKVPQNSDFEAESEDSLQVPLFFESTKIPPVESGSKVKMNLTSAEYEDMVDSKHSNHHKKKDLSFDMKMRMKQVSDELFGPSKRKRKIKPSVARDLLTKGKRRVHKVRKNKKDKYEGKIKSATIASALKNML